MPSTLVFVTTSIQSRDNRLQSRFIIAGMIQIRKDSIYQRNGPAEAEELGIGSSTFFPIAPFPLGLCTESGSGIEMVLLLVLVLVVVQRSTPTSDRGVKHLRATWREPTFEEGSLHTGLPGSLLLRIRSRRVLYASGCLE